MMQELGLLKFAVAPLESRCWIVGKKWKDVWQQVKDM